MRLDHLLSKEHLIHHVVAGRMMRCVSCGGAHGWNIKEAFLLLTGLYGWWCGGMACCWVLREQAWHPLGCWGFLLGPPGSSLLLCVVVGDGVGVLFENCTVDASI